MLFAAHNPASWPEVWSTQAEFDLQQRLNKLPFYAPTSAGFGDTVSDIQALLSKANQILTQAGPYLDTVLQVVQDPAMPQLISRVKTLKSIDAAKSPSTPTAPGTPVKPGVGLARTLPLWDAAIWYTKYPWAPWAIGAGAIVVLGGLGFGVGRWTKKCRAGLGYRRRRS